MLQTELPRAHIRLVDSVAHWQEAVSLVAGPLLEGEFISGAYTNTIFDEYEKSGPYFVIAPGIAIPHARPEDGVHKQGLSLLIVRSGVNFDSPHDPIRIIVMFSATDSRSQANMLSSLAEMLGDEKLVTALSQACRAEEVMTLIHTS